MKTQPHPKTNHSSLRALAVSLALAAALALLQLPCSAQTTSGTQMPGFDDVLGISAAAVPSAVTAHLIDCSVPGNVLWPGQQASFTIQVVNGQTAPAQVDAVLRVIQYGTRGRPNDIWTPDMYKIADVASVPCPFTLGPKAYRNITLAPQIPDTFGAYALVLDMGGQGRQFIGTCVRTFQPDNVRVQYPKFCLDALPPDVLKRIGVHAIRIEVGYVPTASPQLSAYCTQLGAKLDAYNKANVAVLIMCEGAPPDGPWQPLGRPRPWLDPDGWMSFGKFDLAWLPSYDDDFQKFVAAIGTDYGWPKGPVNAFLLWNEPWEGKSISGWGADMPRYRDLYTRMAAGVDQARQTGAQLLVGGCDSTSNALDKLFSDDKDTFLPDFDFVSIHYQGLGSGATIKKWVDRKGPNGRVKIWDTESWIASTDDRGAAVVAADRAAGYDRAMGVFRGNIADEQTDWAQTADGKGAKVDVVNAWSVAAAVGATTHFIGERDFRGIVFKNGLPWVMAFNGMPGVDGRPNPDDGTIVVVGDLGEEFGANQPLFRTARGLTEMKHKQAIRDELASMSQTDPQRPELEALLRTAETLRDALMTMPASSDYMLYDFYGNPVPPANGRVVVPLDGRGFFLRPSGAAGSWTKLMDAVWNSHVDGVEPIDVVAHDMVAPIAAHPVLRLSLTNVLNRPVSGTLRVTLADLAVSAPPTLAFARNDTKQVDVMVTGGAAVASNAYLMSVAFDAGSDGKTTYFERMHVNFIAHRTITDDGKLDDWKGVLPQTLIEDDAVAPSLTESAWNPYDDFGAGLPGCFATAYMAYDDKYFYFAAKIADKTPDPGMPRFATLDDTPYFYPETCYWLDPSLNTEHVEQYNWPPTAEPFALRYPNDPSKGVRGGWEGRVTGLALDVKSTDAGPHQAALYFADWWPYTHRAQTIEALDSNGKVLDKQAIQDFHKGVYLIYDFTGQVRFKISAARDTAVLSGVFFDPPAAALSPNAIVKFVASDDQTAGSWSGKYGSQGYDILGVPAKLPASLAVTPVDTTGKVAYTWPAGVRRYTYRKNPDLPSGSSPNHDNVQIAFNVLPGSEKSWYPYPPGTMPGFTHYQDTDYEYALNPVAQAYGGGTEVWRLNCPGMPHKHFYPREPVSPFDGAVKDAKLVMRRTATMRIVEAGIPWTEIPDVRKALDAALTIKFSYRVNYNSGCNSMELSQNRCVAKRNESFHDDWDVHWANELEFGFEK